jgi:UDP-N-acetyl-D-glucosamine dehydrogenase
MVNSGINYIGDVVDSDLSKLVKSKMLSATDKFEMIADTDFIAVCVPTPLDEHQQPDTSYLKSCAQEISAHIKKGSVVVIESTTYPGTTEGLIKPILEAGSGLFCPKDFYLGFSPERVDPGNIIYKTKKHPEGRWRHRRGRHRGDRRDVPQRAGQRGAHRVFSRCG